MCLAHLGKNGGTGTPRKKIRYYWVRFKKKSVETIIIGPCFMCADEKASSPYILYPVLFRIIIIIIIIIIKKRKEIETLIFSLFFIRNNCLQRENNESFSIHF